MSEFLHNLGAVALEALLGYGVVFLITAWRIGRR